MKDLRINETTTLYLPNTDGEIEISTLHNLSGWNTEYVSFEVLEKWVASIREQIITSSNEQAKGDVPCTWCGRVQDCSCEPEDQM